MAPPIAVAGIVVSLKWAHQLWLPLPGPQATIGRQAVLVTGATLIALMVVGRGQILALAGLGGSRADQRPGSAHVRAVWPAVLAALGWLVVGLTTDRLHSVSSVEVVRIVVATGFGEELLFRGVIYGLVLRDSRRAAVVLSSSSFGLWHLVDAYNDVSSTWPLPVQVAFVTGTLLLMTLVAAVVFAPLRDKTGRIWSPALLHVAWNFGATVAL